MESTMSAPPVPPGLTTPAAATDLAPPKPTTVWARFVQTHLFDYTPASTRLWLVLVGCGALSVAAALWQLARLPWSEIAHIQLGIAFVALAACFPVQLPRTKYSIGVGDVFVFALLATFGAGAAVLAAVTEGLVGACRTTKRLTSRLSTPAAAGGAMWLCGHAFDALRGLLQQWGASDPVATLVALCGVALPYFAGTTLPLMAVIAVKRGERLSLRDWASGYAWFAAISLASAAVAGVLYMNSRQFGGVVIGIAAAVAGAVVLLINVSLRRHEAEHQAQEARIAKAQREAQFNQQRFTASFSHAAIGMAIVQRSGAVLQVNQALATLLRKPESALLGRPFTELLSPGDAALFQRRAAGFAAVGDEAFSMELRCLDAGGAEIWVAMHCSRFADPAGDGSSMIYQLHDITSRRMAEGELHHIAYHDSLTDLANRNCFNERLAEAVERTRLDATQRFAVMYFDLDRFKVTNDSLGHHAGNLLLQEVARRLVACVRPGDLVARLGGDEFAVLLEQLHHPDDALQLAQRLLDATAAPMQLNGTDIVPGASIGVTFSDLGYRTADEVLRDADLAMYEAKAGGRHRVALFDSSMLERITERLQLEGDLRRAIGDGQLSLVFQPLYELEPYRLVAFEALARWMHPVRGPISPAVFIGLAEESGHIEALTAWVIDEAAAQLAQWQRTTPARAALVMHVNISGRDLADPNLVPHVREVLARHALTPATLTLEITETTLMGRLDLALDTLGQLRALGVKFSIDDFGTGYSSLAYLSRLPIDSLKIDRSFIIGMERQPQNVEIVRAVLNLGHSLNKKVVAEGIETAEQLATLREIGVHIGQGYLLSRPLRADQVSHQLLLGEVVAPG